LRARLRKLANEGPAVHPDPGGRGERLGINRIRRLSGRSVRKRRARRKATGVWAPILWEAKLNARWSLDFVDDQFANERRFRVLNIVHDVTKECLGAIPDTSIRDDGWHRN
jgi:putative transposase